MNRFTKTLLVRLLIFACIFVILYPLWTYLFWTFSAPFSDPDMISEIKKEYRQLPSDKLIKKFAEFGNPYSVSFYSPYPMAALNVLVERKETDVVPLLIKFTESKPEPLNQNTMKKRCRRVSGIRW